MRHLLTLFDLTPFEVKQILATGQMLADMLERGDRPSLLQNRCIGLLFEKPSLRTRVSFEAGMTQLGGSSLFLGEDVGWGKRESPADFSKVLGQYLDAVVCRAKSHSRVEELATYDALHVINGLTDLNHPCQSLADLLTIRQVFGSFESRHVVFVGDGNNVARSMALGCAMLEMKFTLACPENYEIDPKWIARITERYPQADISVVKDAKDAVACADVIYTDVWTSMGQEAERETRRQIFKDYCIDAKLLKAAPEQAIVMHCLPAIRGEEISSDVMDGPQSEVIRQAGNRMHAQKGLLVWLMNQDWVQQNVTV